MNTMISGTGSDVLLLHGGGVSGWMWRPVLAQLTGEVRSIVPDLPGHGTSGSIDYVSHAESVARIAQLIRDQAHRGAVVVGFSLGGQLAIKLASEYPELVRAVLIVSAETRPAPARAATLALLKRTAPLARLEWFAKLQAKQLGVPSSYLAEYVRDSQALSVTTLLASVGENLAFELPRAFSDYGRPATVVVGQRERKLMHESARLTHAALPQSTLIVAEHAAHDAPFTMPSLIADEIRALLRASGPSHAK